MKDDILKNLENPKEMERLYRANRTSFKQTFNKLYGEIQSNASAQVWHERLNFEHEEISWGSKQELVFILIASLAAGLIAKLPTIFNLDPEFFYSRNISFIVFPFLILYITRKHQVSFKNTLLLFIPIVLSLVYINSLPNNPNSDTLVLACLHLPLFSWALLGVAFAGKDLRSVSNRLEFLRYNGDWVVMTTLMLISGGILTAVTIGLFQLIDLHIQKFYFDYIVVFGLAAAPLIGTYLVRNNPHLVNKVSPIIAKIFTPLVLLMLVTYLLAIIVTGKDPYNDREFLLIFNALLVGVMALVFFSLTELLKNKTKLGIVILLSLTIMTIVINGIALSAIVFRISTWGITPNRLAVLGSNILMLSNLIIIALQFLKSIRSDWAISGIENSLAKFLPLYALWTMLVIFVFPLIFHFA